MEMEGKYTEMSDKDMQIFTINMNDYKAKRNDALKSAPVAEKTESVLHHGGSTDYTEDKRPTTYMETMMHLFKGNVGLGLFAMGDAYKNSGIAMAPWLLVLFAVICIHGQHLLLNASDRLKDELNLDRHPNFAETVGLCFATGPPRFQKYATFMRRLTNLCLCFTHLGFCCVYFVFIPISIKQVCDYYGSELDVHVYMAVILLLILLSCMVRNLKYLAPLSAIANVFLLIGISTTLYYATQDLPPITSVKLVANVRQFPLFFGTGLFVFEGIGLVLPLKREMEKPKLFGRPLGVLNVGMAVVTFLFVTMGFFSYVKYGEEVQGSVTLNLPKDEMLAQIVKILISLGIAFTFPLLFYVPIEIMFPCIRERFGPLRHPVFAELAFRILFVLLTFTLAIAIPYIDLFISLIGASSTTTIVLFIPPILQFVTHWSKSERTLWMVVKNLGILGLGVLGCVTGCYESIRLIIKAIVEGRT